MAFSPPSAPVHVGSQATASGYVVEIEDRGRGMGEEELAAAIARLCREVLSVAEVSAHLDPPLGVARVLVGDMAFEGLVSIHRPVNPDAQPDRTLLERVLAGPRSI